MKIDLNKKNKDISVIAIEISPNDYQEKVQNILNDYRKKANITGLKGFQSFKKCGDLTKNKNIPVPAKILLNHQKTLYGRMPDHYDFNHGAYTSNFPCQRLFNNNTKRSALPNMHNTFDINPKHLL